MTGWLALEVLAAAFVGSAIGAVFAVRGTVRKLMKGFGQ
jgi:hypothetical protein